MKQIALLVFFVIGGLYSANAQSVLGNWENQNEEGKVNSIIKVFEKDGKVYGKVDRIMKEEDRDRVCTKCDGDLKNKPVEGMEIMQDLEKDGNEYVDGTIVDPKTGKEYRCKIWLDEENPDLLRIRGYISVFYQTRTWQRAE
ncbi:MAG: DUF2147 domain-containing protein [Flavobacteriales bacterium]